MNAKPVARVLIIVLIVLAITALVASAQGEPASPGKAMTDVIQKGESASPVANLYESEPNNGFGTADIMGLYDVMSGKIGTPGDVDYYHIYDDYMPGFTALIDIDAEKDGSPLDAVICIYDENFVQIACNDDSDGLDSMLYVYLADPEDDWELHYYIKVQDYDHPYKGGNDYTYTLSVSRPFFVSPVANGTVSGVIFQKADILSRTWYNDGSSKWILFFDASDVGITKNTNSIDVWPAGAAMAFQANQAIGSGVIATPYDVVQFNADQWGPYTRGWFSTAFLLDGSVVGLSATSEKIDALVGTNIVSTTGAAAVPMAGGGTLKARDEDLIALDTSTGKWYLYFDGSTVPGLAGEDIIAADRDSDSLDPWLDFVILGSGAIDGYNVTQKNVVNCFNFWVNGCDEIDLGLTTPFIIDAYSFRW